MADGCNRTGELQENTRLDRPGYVIAESPDKVCWDHSARVFSVQADELQRSFTHALNEVPESIEALKEPAV